MAAGGNCYAQLLVSSLARASTPGRTQRAILLFTSGSSGEPKGVVLSHHNLIGNVTQFTVMLDAGPEDVLLASLPFFHSFGCTVTLWYPLIEGTPIVTYPSPLEAAKNAALVEKYKITGATGDTNFLAERICARLNRNSYVRRAWSSSAREKMPLDLSEKFFERFGKRVMEGYGLTETAPVVSVNLPDPIPERPDVTVQPLYRPAPSENGFWYCRGRFAGDQRELSIYDGGMLWAARSEYFEGYLKDPKANRRSSAWRLVKNRRHRPAGRSTAFSTSKAATLPFLPDRR